jgi:hypothetical protein
VFARGGAAIEERVEQARMVVEDFGPLIVFRITGVVGIVQLMACENSEGSM